MSDSQNQVPEPKYPDFRHAAEARRLRLQGILVTTALGGNPLLCPLDTSAPGLRILDSATADGHFLTVVREKLAHPGTAELIGTDIAPFPPLDLPENIRLSEQDVLKPWPDSWKGSFDLVHQRNALSVTGSNKRAVEAVRRLIEMVKEGGWVQLVDGSMIKGELAIDDKPSAKLFKMMNLGLNHVGLDSTLGASVDEILRQAGEGTLRGVEAKRGISVCGKGAASEELSKMGYAQLEGLHNATMALLKGMPEEKRPMPLENVEALLPEILAESQEQGVQMTWFAAWGQKN